MLFSKHIAEQAQKAAFTILNHQKVYDQALQSPDAIEALARGVASSFYRYGTLFSIIKVSLLGTYQEITYLYGYTFAHAYNNLAIRKSVWNRVKSSHNSL